MAVLMQDSFTNANGTALSSHVSDNGKSWSGGLAGYQIQNNTAHAINTARQYADFDTGTPNFKYAITFDGTANTSAYSRIRFRDNGADNYYWVVWMSGDNWDLRKNGGAGGVVGSITIPGSGVHSGTKRTTVEIICDGDNIQVTIAGTLAFNITDSWNNTATKVGFAGWNTGSRFDDALIESLGTTEPDPVGTDGEISLSLSQQIYHDSESNLGLTQTIYADSSTTLNLRQEIYRDIEATLNLAQTIYRDATAVLNLSQAIYRDSSVDLATRQEIYADSESILNLIQEFYQDGFSSITLNLIQEIYHDSSTDLSLQQSIYHDGESLLNLVQQTYTELETVLSLTQQIYREDSADLTLAQTIYHDAVSNLNLVQQMYTEGEISLPLLIQIRDDLAQVIGVIHLLGKRELYLNLIGKRELYIPLKGGVSMTVNNPTVSLVAGDSKYLVVTVDGITDLTGCTFEWGLHPRNGENIITKSSTSGINIVDGKVQIKLDPTDTEALYGTYYHECEMTDTLGNVSTIFTGLVSISKSSV